MTVPTDPGPTGPHPAQTGPTGAGLAHSGLAHTGLAHAPLAHSGLGHPALAGLLVLLLLLQAADVATTARALRRPGRREANPLVAAMIRRLGRLWAPAKLAVAAGAAALIWAGREGPLALPAAGGLVAFHLIVVVRNGRKG